MGGVTGTTGKPGKAKIGSTVAQSFMVDRQPLSLPVADPGGGRDMVENHTFGREAPTPAPRRSGGHTDAINLRLYVTILKMHRAKHWRHANDRTNELHFHLRRRRGYAKRTPV